MDKTDPLSAAAAGAAMLEFITPLFSIPRSLTGDGVRQTLGRVAEEISLDFHEIASGTPIFDWTVPLEWNLRRAWIQGPDGRTVVDTADSNLHVVGYSVPVRRRMPLSELREHLFSLPDQPDLIPYRTSYYKEAWGFCLAHRQLAALPEGEYEVTIDATLAPGALTYGECFLPGEEEREVLFSCHICHPALANDNLSGLAVCTFLARELARRPRRRYGYRFLFLPGTVGAITWLARNEAAAGRIAHGLVAANLGDGGKLCYKKSRRGNAEIDRAVAQVLRDSGEDFAVADFLPFGYDERQYNSPGFNLPVGSLTRTPWGQYPEYHTSADNLDFLNVRSLGGSLRTYLAVVELLERNHRYLNLNPKCEPQLGRRGLYRAVGGESQGREREIALLWVLNLSDGEHTLLDIAERSGMSFPVIREAADALLAVALLQELPD
jgi:aminopeptidase-like protein